MSRRIRVLDNLLWLLSCSAMGSLLQHAQEPPRLNQIQAQTNREISLRLSAQPNRSIRVDVSNDLRIWEALSTLRATASSALTDSAAPFHTRRFYRAIDVTDAAPPQGDHFSTSQGDLVFRPINHASFVLFWNGLAIYNDPVGGAGPYASLPRADLILVSHTHGDHFSAATLEALRKAETRIIAPAAVYASLSATLRALAIPLANGQSTNVLNLDVDAIPAYNANHPKGAGNGYVLTLGGKRIYMCGDTEDVPEMRALRGIDVAFICMNVPFTMSVDRAASAIREFQPAVIYPYHFRNQDGTFADLNRLKRLVGTDFPIEVRLRTWY